VADDGRARIDINVEPPRLPRLLVVDDEESVRAYVATALEGSIEVTTAATATEGLELAGSERFDGVLVDHRLPDLTGVEMIRLLRSEAGTASLPVMLFTGESSGDVEDEAREAGADDYLTKPVDPLLLEERALALVARSARVG
jgi:putative two-component system response regulator